MATVLRVNTPAQLRRRDLRFRDPRFEGWMVIAMFMVASGILTLFIGLQSPDATMSVTAALWLAAWGGWLISIRVRATKIDAWRVPVRHGIDELREAHWIYRRLSVEAQGYALPLVDTLYRLSVLEVSSAAGIAKVTKQMRRRVHTLRRLHEAEDRLALYAAEPTLVDRSDTDAAELWRSALDEIDARLSIDL